MLALACAAGCASTTAGTTAGPSASSPAAAGATTGAGTPTSSTTATASITPTAPTTVPTPAPTASAAASIAEHAGAVREAAAATGRTSARIGETVELSDGETTYNLTVAGDFDLAADRGRLDVDFPGGGISHIDEIFADGQVYVRGSAGVPAGSWAAMDRERTVAHALLRAPVNDPEHVLQQISTLTRVTRSGEEELNGVRTTRYGGILADDAVTLRLTPQVQSKVDTYRSMSAAGLQVPAEVWIDPEGRVAKVRMVLTMDPVRSVTTVTFTELGKAVKVTAPPAKNTAAVTELSGALVG